MTKTKTTASKAAPQPQTESKPNVIGVDPGAPDGDAGVSLVDVRTLAAAQALPEVPEDAPEDQGVLFAEGSVERFMSVDRRVMAVVLVDGVVSAKPVSTASATEA